MNEFFSFIKSSPTAYQATFQLSQIFKDQGYVQLAENDHWNLSQGGKYFIQRNGSTFAAFSIPTSGDIRSFMIGASHSDSPCYKLKENPDLKGSGYHRLSIEPYGGMIHSTFLDRVLSIAGRVFAEKDGEICPICVNLDRDLLTIPSVAIHMNRNVNQGVALNPATDMIPVFSLDSEDEDFLSYLVKELNLEDHTILSYDLFACCHDEPRLVGKNGDMILSPRLDDLACTFALAKGMLACAPEHAIPIFVSFDSEEIGSGTMQGADSTFLSDLISRICISLGIDEETHQRLLASSLMVSADNAHAIHPNHPELSDKNEGPRMNGGIVIKHSAPMRYSSDAVSSALFISLLKKENIPFQHFSNRADLVGGSTLGTIAQSTVSIPCVDIGLAQLAMHSAVETMGKEDIETLTKAMSAFFSSHLVRNADKRSIVKGN